MKRIRSGVEVPEGMGEDGRPPVRADILRGEVGDDAADDRRLSPRTVVVLWAFVVSALGGGGSPASSNRSLDGGDAGFSDLELAAMVLSEGRILARHKKHSPVPK